MSLRKHQQCLGYTNVLTVANVPPDPNSGAAGTIWQTNRALRNLGHEVDEIWADQLGPRRITHGNLHSLIEQPRAYRREVLKALSKKQYDVIQISQPQGWLAAKALKKAGYSGLVVNRSHGVELRVNEVLPAWYRKFGVRSSRSPLVTACVQRLLDRQWHQVAKWFDEIVVGCSQDRDCVLRRTGAINVTVAPHGVSEQFFSDPSSPAAGPLRLLHVGQFAFYKGSLLLAEIINASLTRHPHLTFTWVCSSSHHEEIRSSLKGEVQSRVTLLDWMEQSQLVRIFDQHNVFVFPSLYEGFGKAPFEAMARGLCVIASDEAGMRDHIRHGQSGLLCPVGDVAAFVEQIDQLLTGSTNLVEIGRHAMDKANQLTWQACAEIYAQLYQQAQRESATFGSG